MTELRACSLLNTPTPVAPNLQTSDFTDVPACCTFVLKFLTAVAHYFITVIIIILHHFTSFYITGTLAGAAATALSADINPWIMAALDVLQVGSSELYSSNVVRIIYMLAELMPCVLINT